MDRSLRGRGAEDAQRDADHPHERAERGVVRVGPVVARRTDDRSETMAAQIASKANVNQLILTHLSPRYTPRNETSPNDLLNEAKAIFPNTQLAKDFLQIDIKKRCNSS